VPVTVLIVDDHPTFRRFARRMLAETGFDVVGEAADGESAIRAARVLRPAAVLLDVRLPDMSGLEVAARLAVGDEAPVVVLTSSFRVGDDALLMDAAVRSFIPKERFTGAAFAEALETE
jgi:DNA-binding NarL/FixJ family response regulator